MHNQSLERAIDVLERLEWFYGGLGLTQIAERLKLNPSTVHHLLRSLRERGYVDQGAATRRHRLGSRVPNLANGFLRELNLNRVAFPHMKELCDACHENLRLGILRPDSVITVIKVDSHSNPVIQSPIDLGRAPHATRLGKGLLAGLSYEDRRRYLARTTLPRLTARTITDPTAIEVEPDHGDLGRGIH